MSERKVAVGDLEIHVADEGQGSPILFVHGFPLNHRMWQSQLTEFASSHRVIAPDLRGFGKSSATEGMVGMEQFADDLAALLDALGVNEPVTLCGLSMGGYIAWQFVRRQSNRLRALILCDTRAVADTPQGIASRMQLAKTVLDRGVQAAITPMLPKLLAEKTIAEKPQIVDELKAMILSCSAEGIAAALNGMAERPDSQELLATISVPTLCLVGAEDSLSPPEEMRSMAKAIPNSRFAIIEHAGHMAPMENPDEVNAAIREFFEAIEAE